MFSLLYLIKYAYLLCYTDFQRNWNSGGGGGGGNPFNNFGGNGGGGGGNTKNILGSFDRDFGGFNNFNNNSNSSNGGGNFANDRFMNDGGNGGRNMNNVMGQYAVHLRGMPYDCGEEEVHEFFAPLKVIDVQILYNNNGKLVFHTIRKC